MSDSGAVQSKIENRQSAIRMGRVLSFATITALGFAFGKFSGVLREVVVSAHFGLSAELDAYFLAFTVPTIINNIVAGSAITAAIIPTFARYLATESRAEFWRMASVVTNLVLLITAALTALGMIFAAPIIALLGGGFAPSTQALAVNLLVVMMPTLWLGAALNMLMAMLNALDRFTAPALIFLALNFGIIGTVIALSPFIGIYAVAWGFLIGVALQVILQLIELRRERPQFHWRLDLRHPALPRILRAFIPITALSLVAQINYVVDKAMAAGLPPGSISALYYADSILGLFYMLGISLSIAVFPTLSRLAATNDLESAGRAVATSLRLLIFVLTPLSFLLVPFAAPIIGLVLGRGKFDAGAVDLTAQALALYALGLIAIAALYVLQRAFYALSDNVTPFVIGGLTALLHIVLNWALMPSLSFAGIALSTSVSSLAGAIVLVLLLARRVPKLEWAGLVAVLLRCAFLALLSTLPVAWLFAASRLGVETLTARLVGVALAGAGGLVYFLLALVARIPESRMLLNLARGFLPHRKPEVAP